MPAGIRYPKPERCNWAFTRPAISAIRGWMISDSTRLGMTRGSRLPTCTTSIISPSVAIAGTAHPWRSLSRSASPSEVRSPTAMSFVTWFPP